MKRSRRSVQRRRRIAQVSAIVITVAMALAGVLSLAVMEVAADERSDAVAKRDRGQEKINSLKSELTGIDAELADLFIAVEQSRLNVEGAQQELAVAEDELQAAQRLHDKVLAELEDATRELDDLNEAISTAEEKEDALTVAVGDMARDLYRGGSPSPLQVVVAPDGAAGIGQRTAAANSLSRVQSRAMEDVRGNLVVKENQVDKQNAVTDRVSVLEAEAEVAKKDAENLKDEVSGRLDSLQASLAEEEAAQAAWESRKSEAESQLKQADSAVKQAEADIAKIDAENRRKQLVFEQEQAEKRAAEQRAAQKSASPAPSAKSPSPSAPSKTPSKPATSSPAPAPSGGKLFSSPVRTATWINSPFGYRTHPILGISLLHAGVDLHAGCGVPQYPGRAGVVSRTGYNDISGNFVEVNHGLVGGNSLVTRHAHFSSISVSTGQKVNTGTVIGLTGTTGRSTGCHVHWELYRNGTPVNIVPYASF